jgi:hypothetical protein
MEQRCPRCEKTKPLEGFHRDKRRKNGRKCYCIDCAKELGALRYEERTEQVKATNLNWLKRQEHGYAALRLREWRIKNPDKASASDRRANLRKFGLTVADYDKMLEAQGGVCKICNQPEQKSRRYESLCIDHLHSDGWNKLPKEERKKTVRGLLCNNCNRCLGLLKDSIENLEQAAAYLKNFKLKD